MSNQKKNVLIMTTFFAIFLSACNTTSEENAKIKYEYTLKISESLEIPIDSMTNFISTYMDYYEHPKTKENYLVWLNTPDSHIHFYNLRTKKRDIDIPFQNGFNGTDAVGDLNAFIVKNLDTILVTSKNKTTLFIANFEGKILHKAKLKPTEFHIFHAVDNYKRISLSPPSTLIYHKAPYVKVNEGKIWDYAIGFSYDYKKEKYDSIYKFNGETSKSVYSSAHTRYGHINDGKGNYIYSMGQEKYLYVTDYKNKNLKFFAASKFDTKKISKLRLNNTGEEDTKFFLQNFMYKHIIYDKFREVYYRFALHPIDDVGNKWEHGKPFSIIILDKNFTVIGESEIFKEKGIYYYTNFFVAPEGLYISNNHEDNPKLQEDLISFKLFKLLKVK